MDKRVVAITASLAAASAAAGGVAGYFLGLSKGVYKFQKELTAQLAAAEKVFMMKHKVGMYRSPIDLVEKVENNVPVEGQTEEQIAAHEAAYNTRSAVTDQDLGKIIESLRKPEVGGRPGKPIIGGPNQVEYNVPDKSNGSRVMPEEEASLLGMREELQDATDDVNHNLFEEESEQPNYSEYIEENPRTREAPYVITTTEFSTGDDNIDDTYSLVWWDEDGVEGMGVLSDMKDNPIDDIEATVGWDNMEKFGMWSGSKNVVYIRNERLRCDYEVVRHRGSYAEHVGIKVQSQRKRKLARRGADE
jgi:hypothetical protein